MAIRWADKVRDDYSPYNRATVAALAETGFTATTSASVSKGQLLKVTGDGTVGPTGAIADVPVGTAGHDAGNGVDVRVWPLSGGLPHELTASAAVSAGTVVEPSTTAGQVKAFTSGVKVGVALTTFAGAPLKGLVLPTPAAVS